MIPQSEMEEAAQYKWLREPFNYFLVDFVHLCLYLVVRLVDEVDASVEQLVGTQHLPVLVQPERLAENQAGEDRVVVARHLLLSGLPIIIIIVIIIDIIDIITCSRNSQGWAGPASRLLLRRPRSRI